MLQVKIEVVLSPRNGRYYWKCGNMSSGKDFFQPGEAVEDASKFYEELKERPVNVIWHVVDGESPVALLYRQHGNNPGTWPREAREAYVRLCTE